MGLTDFDYYTLMETALILMFPRVTHHFYSDPEWSFRQELKAVRELREDIWA